MVNIGPCYLDADQMDWWRSAKQAVRWPSSLSSQLFDGKITDNPQDTCSVAAGMVSLHVAYFRRIAIVQDGLAYVSP